MNAISNFSNNWITKVKQLLKLDPVIAIYGINFSSASGLDIETSGFERVDFNVKSVDTHNAVTTGANWKFTVPVGYEGTYAVLFRTTVNDTVIGFDATVEVSTRLNTEIVSNKKVDWKTNDNYPEILDYITLASLVAGDELYFEWNQSAGPSRSVDAALYRTRVEIVRIGN